MTPFSTHRIALFVALVALAGCSKTPDKSGERDTSNKPAVNVQRPTEGQKSATITKVAASENGDKSGSPAPPQSGNPASPPLRHLKGDSATLVYRFGSTANEKAWTGPSGLAFMSDSKRICVLGDSPFNAILSVPEKTRLRSPNPSFDDHLQMTKVGSYEWQPPTVAAYLVDNLATHNTAVATRDELHKTWRTKGWSNCEISQKGTYLAVADSKLGKMRVVRLSDNKTMLDFDSSQWHPKPSDDKSQFGSGSSSTSGDTVRFAFSPDESKIALAIRTKSSPPRAFLALFATNNGSLLHKTENFCPTTMLFSPDAGLSHLNPAELCGLPLPGQVYRPKDSPWP